LTKIAIQAKIGEGLPPLTRRRDVPFTLEECPSYGGKHVKTKQVKTFHGEGCQSTFFTKKTTVLHPSMRACLKKKTAKKGGKTHKSDKKRERIFFSCPHRRLEDY
jgi:hypothetical protein